jgi:hypothetical protein
MAEFEGVLSAGRTQGPPASILPSHQAIRSVVATGGVYKGQGRIQRGLMTHDYKAFRVHEHSSSAQFPARCGLNGLPRPLGIGGMPIGRISVARVRPRTSKGITDLLLPSASTS